ncbi:SDR family oxidoreductase [Fulvivirgaceae bacterium BMA10]|uniref:SDR family oxidoreductase n=1 Tax=Splendidivirga corallicola TaxID=3051826 RepID=A0ABT8KKL5_9BACT|nr:SDR family oxidoreductase [Fulvivirgaceae bacterium BMA10]
MSKVVLITGASSGIGEAIANYLSQHGYKVYGTSRNPQSNSNGKFRVLKMDVNNEGEIKEALKVIVEQEGRVDVLINNAGLGIAGSVEETDLEQIQKVMNTNVFGVIKVCRAILPIMRKQNDGLIINVSSIGGYVGLPFRGIYSASKFALEGLSEALSMEVKSFGIKTCLLQLGDFNTNINANRLVGTASSESPYYSAFDKILNQINEEVAEASDPILVAQVVEKIIKKKKPKLRYVIGKPLQKLTIPLKKILPGRLFEKILSNHYQLK